MEKILLLQKLKQYKKLHKQKYDIELLGVFGSFARNEACRESDVDVVVHLKKQDLFNIIGIKQDLEESLHVPVDLVSYRKQMDSFLKEKIDQEAIYV